MDITLILIRLGAILAAVGAGWALGRSNPSWEIDRTNENMPRYHYGYGMGYGYGTGYGCAYLGGFFSGSWGAVVLGVVAIILAVLGWRDPVMDEMSRHTGGAELLFTPGFWIIVGCALAGYIAGRVTDKGPVGPLE